MRRAHRPVSSYRLQFNAGFRFADAAGLVPYLDTLGVTDCYASPLLRATPGSEHGYDICDHSVLNPELGTEADFERLATALRARDMGLIFDVVPNHMSLDPSANRWWRDVLMRGEASPFAEFFDIDWTPLTPELHGRVLLPILDDQYGEVLHRGEIRLEAAADGLVVRYGDRRLPLAPDSWALHAEQGSLSDIVTTLNGIPGRPETFDRLHRLLEQQVYRLAYWKTSFDEINYRRFFDVNHLGTIRMELPHVFEQTHRKVLSLIAQGHVTGLRLDHTDGLHDPAGYVTRLRDAIAALPSADDDAPPFHVVVEKILARGESLPASWPISGTTGYGFLNDVTGLFVDHDNDLPFQALYRRVTGRQETYHDVSYRSRRLVMRSSMASELAALAQRLKEIAEADRRTRDFTVTALRRAIAEVVACMPVYRTYITADGFEPTDRETIDVAIDGARRCNPVMASSVFLFLRSILLADGSAPAAATALQRRFAMRFQQFSAPIQAKGIEDTAFYRYNALLSLNEVGVDPAFFGTSVDDFHAGNRVRLERWRREMTTTATHDTKRGEDTRARLNVLSEMPADWQRAVMQWRRLNTIRRTSVDRQPAPDANDEYLFYQTLVGVWPLEPVDAPVPQEAPADIVERLELFMLKAIRESKTHTSWLNQNRAYEDAVRMFVENTLRGRSAQPFLTVFVPFMRQVASAGIVNSLAQLVLKIGAPGVPDFYQGTELWQFALPDPDNRRAVDFPARVSLLEALAPLILRCEAAIDGALERDEQCARAVAEMMAHAADGRIKLFITALGLRLRRAYPELFIDGSYEPLRVEGPAAAHLIVFLRRHREHAALIAVPRLATTLARAAEKSHRPGPWAGSWIVLPDSVDTPFVNLFCGTTSKARDRRVPLDDLFATCPVALLLTRTVDPPSGTVVALH